MLSKYRRRAFTLIELLVVVAIIALLVAILLPTLQEARTQALNMLCATNQRQIAIAWHTYLSDNNYIFPPTGGNIHFLYGGKHPAVINERRMGIDYRPLNPYISMRLQNEQWADVFRCPFDRPMVGGEADGYTLYEFVGNCYMFNYFLHHPTAYDEYGQRRFLTSQAFHLDDVEFEHSLIMLIGDFQWYYTHGGVQAFDAQFHSPPDYMNLAFLDGHVEFTRILWPNEIAAGAIPQYKIDPCKEDSPPEE